MGAVGRSVNVNGVRLNQDVKGMPECAVHTAIIAVIRPIPYLITCLASGKTLGSYHGLSAADYSEAALAGDFAGN